MREEVKALFVALLFISLLPLVLADHEEGHASDEFSFELDDDEIDDNVEEQEDEEDAATAVADDDGDIDTSTLTEADASYDTETQTIDLTQMAEDSVDLSIEGTASEDYSYETNEGTISDYSLKDSLFSFGSFIQGTVASFSMNNGLNFGSVFDLSTFTLTLNDEDEATIAQQNSFGSTGQVYVSMTGGNLTQDDYIIFIPEGDDPTYIYYNTTEIAFEDGDIYLLGEAVTNNDDTDESTTVAFNENGFTKVELHPNNTYTIQDFSIENTGDDTFYICKDDALCDVDISDSLFSMEGVLRFSYQEEVLYESFDTSQVFSVNVNTGLASSSNRNGQEGLRFLFYTGHHAVRETDTDIYVAPLETYVTGIIQDYRSDALDKNFTIGGSGHLWSHNFVSYLPSDLLSDEITGSVIAEGSEGPASFLALLFIIFGAVGFLALAVDILKMKKKGQASIFIMLGLVLVLSLIVVLYLTVGGSEAREELAVIESLDDASTAVENCVEELVEASVYEQGMYGGILEAGRGASSFDTVYGLMDVADMEAELSRYLETEVDDCLAVLDSTSYSVEGYERMSVDVSLGESITVAVPSLGSVVHEAGSQSLHDLDVEVEVDFSTMYSIMGELYNQSYGVPIENYAAYQIELYVDAAYTEQLISLRDEATGYVYQVTQRI